MHRKFDMWGPLPTIIDRDHCRRRRATRRAWRASSRAGSRRAPWNRSPHCVTHQGGRVRSRIRTRRDARRHDGLWRLLPRQLRSGAVARATVRFLRRDAPPVVLHRQSRRSRPLQQCELGQLVRRRPVQGLKIAVLVPEHELVFGGVTLKDALDMATGHYISAAAVNESSPLSRRSYRPNRTPSIRHRVPHVPLSRATRQAMGLSEPRHLHRDARDDDLSARISSTSCAAPVYEPAGSGFMQTLRTDNAADGQPNNGLFYNTDDVAKLIRLITDDHGQAGGRRADRSMLDAALSAIRTPDLQERDRLLQRRILGQAHHPGGVPGDHCGCRSCPVQGVSRSRCCPTARPTGTSATTTSSAGTTRTKRPSWQACVDKAHAKTVPHAEISASAANGPIADAS